MPDDAPGSEHRLRLGRRVTGSRNLCRTGPDAGVVGIAQQRRRCIAEGSTIRRLPGGGRIANFHCRPRQRLVCRRSRQAGADVLHYQAPRQGHRARRCSRVARHRAAPRNAALGGPARRRYASGGRVANGFIESRGAWMMARRTYGRGDKASLLLVDDDAALCDTLGRALAKRGFDVKTALTVEAASKLANESPPGYAVVDLRLPDKPGLKLVSTLIALDPHTRIVVLTGYGSIATAMDAFKLGASYSLCKPVDADDVTAAFYHNVGDGETAAKEKPMSIKRLEWEHICQVLREHNGNVSQAARALSMHRRTLQRKLAKRPVKN